MASFNKVILMGNLTADPELRTTPSGMAVTELRLAVNHKRKDQDEVLYIDCTVWDKQAENCVEFLSKGRPVLVEGRLKMEQWEDKETGQKRSKITVTAQSVTFLGSANDTQGSRHEPKPKQGAKQGNLGNNIPDSEVPF